MSSIGLFLEKKVDYQAFMKENSDDLDRIDHRILAELANNARISMAALADVVGLSKSPTLARVRRLEQAGYILGYRTMLDATKLGRAQVAFVQVTLSSTTSNALDAFNAAVLRAPEIEACHMIAGGFDYLLKVRVKDVAAYRKALSEIVSNLPYVAQTSTFMAMEIVKEA